MKNNRITISGRMMFILSAIALFTILFFPMWQIQLTAPQYPEGLVLLIFPNKIGGNVDIINGLNHYIGMKPIHASDFFEFTVLPYIICFFSLTFLITGISGNRKLMNGAFLLFLCFGIIAMIDFWKWEYNYGHNLNPDAAIIVPGMAYQPPLIGFKQLLNFGAYSIPDLGGWIFVGVGVILLYVVLRETISIKRNTKAFKTGSVSLAMLTILFFSSCTVKPEPLVLGKDNCFFCKMTISDIRFGAEIITKKGKIYKFDDPHCVISFLQGSKKDPQQIKGIYFTDFKSDHSLIVSEDVIFLKSEALRAPMGGDLSAFNNPDSLKEVMKEFNGSILHWNDIYKQ